MTPEEMAAQQQFLLIMGLLAVGSYGWGWLFTTVIDAIARRRQAEELGRLPGPQLIAIGVALFLAYSGFAISLGLGYFQELCGWLMAGSALALVRLATGLRSGARRIPTLRSVACWACFIAVSMTAYGAAISGPLNPDDDTPAYLYLAQRLLATGNLIDPFNFRRITAYGGGEALQALVLHGSGSGAALGIEWFFFTLLCVALVVGRSSRPMGAIAVLLIGLALAVVHPVGAWANSGPTFSGVALTIAVLQVYGRPGRTGSSWPESVTVGVLAAGLLALRFEFVVPVAVVVAAVSFRYGLRRGIRSVAVVAGVGVVAVAGWAVALDESSRTLLFPLMAGNDNTSFPWADPAFRGLHLFVSRAWAEIGTDGWGWEMAGLVVVVILLLWHRYRFVALVVASASFGCFAMLIAETKSLSGGSLADVGRYNAPSLLAVSLFAIDAIWRVAEDHAAALRARSASMRWAERRAVPLSLLALALVLIAPPIDGTLPNVPPYGGAIHTIREATYGDTLVAWFILRGELGYYDKLQPEDAVYALISSKIPQGSKVLAAVDDPGLLDFSRFDFATLDIVGAVSPPPGIPVEKGERAVVAYLKKLGYDGVVASISRYPGLYYYTPWDQDLSSGIEDYRAMGTEFVDWAHVLSALNVDPRIKRIRVPGGLEYLEWSAPAHS